MNRVIWMVLVGLFIATGSVQAHCGRCGMGDAPKSAKQGKADQTCDRMERMTKDLNLTAEQKTQVEAIMKEKMAKKQQIIDQKEAAMAALHDEVKAKMKGVLSDEQMQKWEAKKAGCPDCKDGKPCGKCKGKMKGHCPDCKDGKPCDKCPGMKAHCPDCKDGKLCDKCKGMKGHCPDCKPGKPCKVCKLKMKGKKGGSGHDEHGQY